MLVLVTFEAKLSSFCNFRGPRATPLLQNYIIDYINNQKYIWKLSTVSCNYLIIRNKTLHPFKYSCTMDTDMQVKIHQIHTSIYHSWSCNIYQETSLYAYEFKWTRPDNQITCTHTKIFHTLLSETNTLVWVYTYISDNIIQYNTVNVIW